MSALGIPSAATDSAVYTRDPARYHGSIRDGYAPVITAPTRDIGGRVIWAGLAFIPAAHRDQPPPPTGPVEFNSRLAFSPSPSLIPLAALDHAADHELIRLAVAQGYTRDDYAWVWVS